MKTVYLVLILLLALALSSAGESAVVEKNSINSLPAGAKACASISEEGLPESSFAAWTATTKPKPTTIIVTTTTSKPTTTTYAPPCVIDLKAPDGETYYPMGTEKIQLKGTIKASKGLRGFYLFNGLEQKGYPLNGAKSEDLGNYYFQYRKSAAAGVYKVRIVGTNLDGDQCTQHSRIRFAAPKK